MSEQQVVIEMKTWKKAAIGAGLGAAALGGGVEGLRRVGKNLGAEGTGEQIRQGAAHAKRAVVSAAKTARERLAGRDAQATATHDKYGTPWQY